jgi:crossover junction endodeoxyribonuclease RuvC
MFMIIGIDPGQTGSLVAMKRDGTILDTLLMPTIKIGTKTRVNGAAIAAWLEEVQSGWNCMWYAYLEKVGPMPKQQASSSFSFGHAAGLVEGVLTGAGISLTLVSPQAWKKHAGLIGTDKDVARSRAVQLYPGCRMLDQKGKGQAIADALLIARYGLSCEPGGSI